MELILNLFNLFDSALLSQIDLRTVADEGVSKLMIIAVVIAVGGIIAAGFQLMAGSILNAVYILLGSLLIGAAPVVASSFVVQ